MKHIEEEFYIKETSVYDKNGLVAVTAFQYDGDQVEVRENNESWLDMRRRTDHIRIDAKKKQKSIAKSITEAFNVTNETGYTPRQLAEQVEQLEKSLVECKSDLGREVKRCLQLAEQKAEFLEAVLDFEKYIDSVYKWENIPPQFRVKFGKVIQKATS